MQFCLIYNNYDFSKIIKVIEPTITFSTKNLLSTIAEQSAELENKIFFEGEQIDWVLYCTNYNIKFAEFQKYIQLQKHDHTIFLTDKNSLNFQQQNFYCKPHVLSMLSSHAKLSTPNIVQNIDDTNRFFYLSLRLNLTLIYI